MPDAPVAAAAAPVTQPVTQPAATPTPAAPTNIIGEIQGTSPVMVRDRDGTVQTKTFTDLADAYRNRLEPSEMEDFKLMQKALKENDAVAAQALVTKYSGGVTHAAPPAAPPPAVNADVAAMQKEMAEMRAQLASIAPTATTVQEAMELQQIGQSLDVVKDKIPFLIQHPERAQLVRTRLNYYADLAKSQNLQLDKLPLDVRQKVYVKAMDDVEASLKQTVGYYQKTTNGHAGPNVTSVNDQGKAAPPGVKPARYQIINGQMVDTSLPQAAPSVSAALPTTPITPPTGGTVGVNGTQAPQGRMTGQQMMESMRARSQVLSQV